MANPSSYIHSQIVSKVPITSTTIPSKAAPILNSAIWNLTDKLQNETTPKLMDDGKDSELNENSITHNTLCATAMAALCLVIMAFIMMLLIEYKRRKRSKIVWQISIQKEAHSSQELNTLRIGHEDNQKVGGKNNHTPTREGDV